MDVDCCGGDDSAAAVAVLDVETDLTNVVGTEETADVESEPSVLIKTESSAVLVDCASTLVLVLGKVTEISDGKILNERIAVEVAEEATGAVDRASATADVDRVMGTIGPRDEGAAEPVIVVIEGFNDCDWDWIGVVEDKETESVLVFGGTTIVWAAPDGGFVEGVTVDDVVA